MKRANRTGNPGNPVAAGGRVALSREMKTLNLRTCGWIAFLAAVMALAASCASISRGKTNVDDTREPQNGFILWRRSL